MKSISFYNLINKKILLMYDEKIIQSFPEVLYKDKKAGIVKKNKFDANRIYESLIRETSLSEEDAEKVTLDVFRFIASSNLTILTAPLLRELVSYTLSKFGFEIARLQNTRIGFPYKDLANKIDECKDVTELKDFIYHGVLDEFNEVRKLIEEPKKSS
jgi:anaerobic ribonucleoside-triphosphate reductase